MRNFFAKTELFLDTIKFEHSIFALPFAYLGLLMGAGGWPGAATVFWITVAMVSFRTMAMALNRLVDRRIDAANPRTAERALPQKKLSVRIVWTWAILSFLVFEWSAWRLRPLCFWLSPVPVALAVLYPFMKRFTWGSHFVLGLILGIAPYGAWIAVTGQFAWAPAFLTAGVMTWVAGFDMIYALQDMDHDRVYGLHSFPAKFGQERTLRLTKILHVVTVFCWAAAGFLGGMGSIYSLGLFLAVYFLVREHLLIRTAGIAKMNEVFFVMNAVVSITLCAAAVLDVNW